MQISGFGTIGWSVLAGISIVTNAFAVVSIDYVSIGNAGNAADSTGYGSVSYAYNIGKYEVTSAQYTEFLNAKGASDSYGLYNSAYMPDYAGITRSGNSGSHTYSVTGASANKPVIYVSWFDAARFTNWMHNGQGNGSTENGVYQLNGAMSGAFTAQSGATIWLPTENEWYKAAYYDPNKNGSGGYWLYPTQSNQLNGNIVGVAGGANYWNGVYAVTQTNVSGGIQNFLTDVGAYGQSSSAYGTFDQGGNVYEWGGTLDESVVVMRGGDWNGDIGEYFLRSSIRSIGGQSAELQTIGFRVASTVPEPTTLALTVLFSMGLLTRRKR